MERIIVGLNEERILLLKGTAGLGNRLVTYAYAQEYALRSGRKLIVDWTDGQFHHPNSNAFTYAFQSQEQQYETSESIQAVVDRFTSYYPSAEFAQPGGVYDYATFLKGYNRWPYQFLTHRLKGRFARWLSAWKLKSAEANLIYSPFSRSFLELGERLPENLDEDVVVFASFLPPIKPGPIKKHVQLNSHMSAKLDGLIHNLKIDQDTLGVHVRSTDKTPPRSISALVELLERESENYKQLFLSTDNVEVRGRIAASFKNVVFQNTDLLSTSSQGLHQKAFQSNDYSRVLDIYEESILDMWALSRCGGLLYQGNSTFSVISRHLHIDDKNCRNWLDLC